MGLDFSHGNAHWSYSGFNNFRRRLAAQIGLDLNDMIGFGGWRTWDDINDKIKPFLTHSDCDGSLTIKQMKVIIPRLKELTKEWAEDDYDKQNCNDLIKGMQKAIKENKKLQFL